MHYRFSDPHLDPPGTDLSCYSEETIRLPETYWCYAPGGEAPDVSPLPADENGWITFGCLNQFAKISELAMEIWCEILKRVNESRLLMHAPVGGEREAFCERLGGLGIARGRVEFVERQAWEPYMRTYHRIDVGLDPFPYGGGITTCDAMWMGVPVISLSGETPVGRGGRSILNNVELGDLVAYSRDQYVNLAVDHASDRSRLGELRRRLRERMRGSALMNGPRFARSVEGAYRDAWRRWCARA
jgi:protein O-GlcNAc transferase